MIVLFWLSTCTLGGVVGRIEGGWFVIYSSEYPFVPAYTNSCLCTCLCPVMPLCPLTPLHQLEPLYSLAHLCPFAPLYLLMPWCLLTQTCALAIGHFEKNCQISKISKPKCVSKYSEQLWPNPMCPLVPEPPFQHHVLMTISSNYRKTGVKGM